VRVRQFAAFGIAVLLALGAGACSTAKRGVAPTTSTVSTGTTSSTLPPHGPLDIPLRYEQACANEPSVCESHTTGVVPIILKRPLRLPVIRPGQPCPASPGVAVTNSYFVGVALGQGPVRPIPAAQGDLNRGIVDLSTDTGAPGWLAFKTLWFSVPSYQGPFVIRAKRLDGTGPIAFGETPTLPPLVVPPGETLNSHSGYRTAPGGTWVKAPGCYGWQIDGQSFSEIIVVDAVLPAP
jgi:hypothetical protein